MPDTKNKKPPRNPVQGDHLQTVLDTITQRLGNSTRTGGGGGRRTNAVEAGGEQNIKPVVVPVGSAAEASTAPTRFQAPTIGSTRTIADIPTTADPETGLYGPSKREDYSTGRVGGLMGGFQIGAKMGEGKDPMYAMGATLGAGLAGLFNPSKLDEIRYRADQDIIDQENQRVLMRSRASRELEAMNKAKQEEAKIQANRDELKKDLDTINDVNTTPQSSMAVINKVLTNPVYAPFLTEAQKQELVIKRANNMFALAGLKGENVPKADPGKIAEYGEDMAKVRRVKQIGKGNQYSAQDEDGTTLFVFSNDGSVVVGNSDLKDAEKALAGDEDFQAYMGVIRPVNGQAEAFEKAKQEAWRDAVEAVGGASGRERSDALPRIFEAMLKARLSENVEKSTGVVNSTDTVTIAGKLVTVSDLDRKRIQNKNEREQQALAIRTAADAKLARERAQENTGERLINMPVRGETNKRRENRLNFTRLEQDPNKKAPPDTPIRMADDATIQLNLRKSAFDYLSTDASGDILDLATEYVNKNRAKLASGGSVLSLKSAAASDSAPVTAVFGVPTETAESAPNKKIKSQGILIDGAELDDSLSDYYIIRNIVTTKGSGPKGRASDSSETQTIIVPKKEMPTLDLEKYRPQKRS